MDFFEQQDQARKKTGLLVLYFVLAVLGTLVAVYAAVLLIYFKINQVEAVSSWWHPQVFAGVVGGTLFIIFLGWSFKIYELAQGGAAIATMLGGRPLSSTTTNPDEKKLLNIVEEMALASGIPVPPVYLLDQETGINAFAAGYTPSSAVIGVTRGSIQQLTRDELQGVIGHEFSHILNGDMRLNIRLISLAAGILALATVGYWIVRVTAQGRVSNDSGKNKNPAGALVLLGLALLIIGYIGVFFANLIKAAISREREFLADASAVQFTRNPDGLSGALAKIAGWKSGSQLQVARATETSHMFFSNGLTSSWLNFFATHPPLTERIIRLEGHLPENFVTTETAATTDPETGLVSNLASTQLIATVGRPQAEHLAYAADLQLQLPQAIINATHETFSACALIYALLLNGEEAPRTEQLSYLEANTDSGLAVETQKLAQLLHDLPPEHKLPLLDLSIPALRELSPDQYDHFVATLQTLIEADQQIDLFEWTLQKVLLRHLSSHFTPERPTPPQYRTLTPLLPDLQCLLSALAHVGSGEPSAVAQAYQAGWQALASSQTDLPLLPAEHTDLSRLDTALNRLMLATSALKKNVLFACACTVQADQQVTLSEMEILRAIADTLDCPIPPILAPV
jgi:Zn-dependent protease with chaperone function